MFAPPASSASGSALFAKNSDRQRNEAQVLELLPARNSPADATRSCTYITIPEAPRTHATLLSRPYWMWGAEMGANEHGVVIGNEGLDSPLCAPTDPALTGMDLLRLALERAASAVEAVEVITTLLERHGQGGDGGHQSPSFYNNGFLIAGRDGAYVLETVGREWLLEQVSDIRTISNCYSIDRAPNRISAGLDQLVPVGVTRRGGGDGYAGHLGDRCRQHVGQAEQRRTRSSTLLQAQAGALDVATMFAVLRDHGEASSATADWHPRRDKGRRLCLHACGHDYPSQTTASFVSAIGAADAVHWATGTAAPCTSLFKPVLIGSPLPSGPAPSAACDPAALWWRHELLHRAALAGELSVVLWDIAEEQTSLETLFVARMDAVISGGDARDRAEMVSRCWSDAEETERRWRERLLPAASFDHSAYGAAWTKMNLVSGVSNHLAGTETQP